MHNIFIGTSGYSYSDWKERFYPSFIPQSEYLSYYASHFPTLEVNATFYGSFKPEIFRKWHNQTPDDFRFTIKGPRLITHVRRLRTIDESLSYFINNISYLGNKLSIILWQFPDFFTCTTQTYELLTKFVASLPHQVKQVVELRDTSWFTDAVYSMLNRYQAGFVINDTTAFPTAEVVTGDIVYIRFHGPESLYASAYSTEQLRKWADRIHMYQEEYDVYCYFNNDVSGYAIENARALTRLLNNF